MRITRPEGPGVTRRGGPPGASRTPPRSCRPTSWRWPRRRRPRSVSPPRYSLVSTNGPSVNSSSPLVASALKARSASSSKPPANTYVARGLDLVHDRHRERTAAAEPLLGVVADPLLVEVDEVLGHVCSFGSGGPGARLNLSTNGDPPDTTAESASVRRGELHAGFAWQRHSGRVLREVLLVLAFTQEYGPELCTQCGWLRIRCSDACRRRRGARSQAAGRARTASSHAVRRSSGHDVTARKFQWPGVQDVPSSTRRAELGRCTGAVRTSGRRSYSTASPPTGRSASRSAYARK